MLRCRYEILHAHRTLPDRNRHEQLIAECIANGEKNIQLPRPYARTKYSAIEGLNYLSTKDPSDWANVYMALYYGFDSIIGY